MVVIFVTNIKRRYAGTKPGELHTDVEEDSREAGVECEHINIIIITTIIVIITILIINIILITLSC